MENQKNLESKQLSKTKNSNESLRRTSLLNLSQRPMRSMNRLKSFRPWKKIKIITETNSK